MSSHYFLMYIFYHFFFLLFYIFFFCTQTCVEIFAPLQKKLLRITLTNKERRKSYSTKTKSKQNTKQPKGKTEKKKNIKKRERNEKKEMNERKIKRKGRTRSKQVTLHLLKCYCDLIQVGNMYLPFALQPHHLILVKKYLKKIKTEEKNHKKKFQTLKNIPTYKNTKRLKNIYNEKKNFLPHRHYGHHASLQNHNILYALTVVFLSVTINSLLLILSFFFFFLMMVGY